MKWVTLLLLHALSTASSASAKLTSPTISHSDRHLFATRQCHDGHRSNLDGPLSTPVAFISSPYTRSMQYRGSKNFHRPMTGNADVDTTSPDADAGYGEDDNDDYVNRGLRFSGVGRLYANTDTSTTVDAVLDRLTSATVAIIGIGGVGSWAAESLCRSGIGNLILVDLDDICISNTNRQLHATTSAVGKMKIDETKTRLLDINPKCNVTLVHDFVTVENANTLLESLLPQLTACIDAIDGMYEKTALILACVDHGIPIVTCGGAAGRMDPTQIVVDDLTKVQEDRLLFKSRKLLRQKHGFPKVAMPGQGKKIRVRKWRIPAVYSTEVQQKPPSTSLDENVSSFRTCDGALGTACFVTGTYGFVAASKVVEMIALDKLEVPKKLGYTEESPNDTQSEVHSI
eukprot:CAMPEP_0172308706 /NCGR_PEP_ID=MMETSP1058-20130122/9222_1 /TAXON_ID=83371 /ORGANISM="Detonula confervacea, Strain CCMP 353" /LENGTH=400 /DNA_ID=CAMNT_0013021185 /DNA_START=168 /DNA_END=1370 /DNA_ORIENTATION=+